MKRIFIVSSLVVTVFTSVVCAQNINFSRDIGLGSVGQDVTQLQNLLISKGFHIPTIESGLNTKGHFGSQTKVAVMAFQKSQNISHTGFIGPITRKLLNSIITPTTALMSSPTMTTPGSTPVVGTTGTISTPGAVGTLAVSLWSTPSGIVAYKGQAYDVAAYKVQASASDMAIQNLTLDFDVRLWLYASSITIKDDSGAVVGQVNNLNSSNFSELTVGSDYRVSVPVNGYVVRATQIKYLTVNVSFLPTSDRATGTVNVLSTQIRSVDGTGVTDTELNTGGARSFSYQGSGSSQLVATMSPSNPPVGFIEISPSVPTEGAVLGVYSLESRNQSTTLRSLKVNIGIFGNGNTNGTISNLFNSISLKIGDAVVGTGSLGTTTGTAGGYEQAQITFSNLSAILPADKFVDVSVIGSIAQDSGSRFEGVYATTTLDLTNSSNIDVEDASYAHIAPNSILLASNIQQFTESNILLGGMPSVLYGSTINNSTTYQTTQKFSFVLPLTASKNAIYISKNIYTAIGTSTSPAGITINPVDFSDNDTSGDGSTYFYLAPGQTKTFTAIYQASGTSTNSGSYQVTSLTYGTDSSAVGGYMYSPDITNILTATLFH